MNLPSYFRDRLGLKLFISYLLIIIISTIVLAGTAEFHAPTVLARHIERMQEALGSNPELAADLQRNFDAAIVEILAVGTLVAVAAAVGVSVFVTRRIVGPIQIMLRASHHIASGDYHERIPVPSADELGALARSFNQMAEELERTEQRRLDLIGNVAHELRTPLSAMRATIEGVVDGVLPAESETFISIQHEIARLQRLVHDLEELSRAEAGQIVLDKRAIAPDELVQAAVKRLAHQFDDKGVKLEIDIPSSLPSVSADPERITQVLLNLLGNALQYTPAGGQVRLRARQDRGMLVIEVQDKGIGIAPEHLPHIFERFYRVDKSRSRARGGSGIGLTITRHLVEAHGGRIWAVSDGLGQGSTFTFLLPLAR